MQETPPVRGDNLSQERQSDLPSVQEHPEGESVTRRPEKMTIVLTVVALLLMTPFIIGIILTLLGVMK